MPATLTSILAGALISASRAVINTNLDNLNTTKADLTSPSLLGIPIAPTAAYGTNTTQLATTAFAQQVFSSVLTVESSSTPTYSLATTANQKVIVWAKGTVLNTSSGGSDDITISLK